MDPGHVAVKKSRPNPVNAARKARNFTRAYYSDDRVEWIKRQPSVVSGWGPCVNAHYITGGAGRKAGYTAIVPLTDAEHRELHQHGLGAFQLKYGISLAVAAAETERRWKDEGETFRAW